MFGWPNNWHIVAPTCISCTRKSRLIRMFCYASLPSLTMISLPFILRTFNKNHYEEDHFPLTSNRDKANSQEKENVCKAGVKALCSQRGYKAFINKSIPKCPQLVYMQTNWGHCYILLFPFVVFLCMLNH